jgi:hypothetical protein
MKNLLSILFNKASLKKLKKIIFNKIDLFRRLQLKLRNLLKSRNPKRWPRKRPKHQRLVRLGYKMKLLTKRLFKKCMQKWKSPLNLSPIKTLSKIDTFSNT